MLRIRRRFALLICCGCLLIFLSLYVILNYAAPAANAKKVKFTCVCACVCAIYLFVRFLATLYCTREQAPSAGKKISAENQ